jgi:cell division protein FtsQ
MKMKKNIKIKTRNSASQMRNMNIYFLKASYYLKLFIFLFLLAIFLLGQFTNYLNTPYIKWAEFMGDYGFQLETVEISGAKHVSETDIVKSLNADVGTPLFMVDISNAKKNISSNQWVKDIIIKRKLPDTISVALIERKAIALWQVNQKLSVIDVDGKVIESANPQEFSNFIHVIGNDANLYAYDLIQMLKKDTDLAGKILNATRFGARRWNFNLEQDIIVQMPQYGIEEAFSYLSKIYKDGKLFDQKISKIDLRDSKKRYIEYK